MPPQQCVRGLAPDIGQRINRDDSEERSKSNCSCETIRPRWDVTNRLFSARQTNQRDVDVTQFGASRTSRGALTSTGRPIGRRKPHSPRRIPAVEMITVAPVGACLPQNRREKPVIFIRDAGSKQTPKEKEMPPSKTKRVQDPYTTPIFRSGAPSPVSSPRLLPKLMATLLWRTKRKTPEPVTPR